MCHPPFNLELNRQAGNDVIIQTVTIDNSNIRKNPTGHTNSGKICNRERPGFDTVGQGMSGLLSLLTDPEKPQGVGISLSDHLSGIYATYGILAALVNRMATGEGQWVETSLLRASVSFLSENAVRYFETGVVPRRATRTRTAGVFAFVDREEKPFIIHL
ncbi:MAG: CoA transferase, partial [candidate division Zixibacteria bacterium]|nr:CoA transferase [candidate division Zixibacteria bacterium]